jgi:putative hydrolase of the HAD superfamily
MIFVRKQVGILAVTVKCVGFDLYSTLINADNPNWDGMMKAAFTITQDLGYKGTYEDFREIRSRIYRKWREYRERNHVELKTTIWWKEILEALNLEFNEDDLSKIILASHHQWRIHISLYPEVKELLSNLKKNYKIVCISNISNGALAREDMDIFGILDIFDLVVMSSDLGIRKPSPKIFEHVLNKLNVKKSEMIFIGDTLYDDVQGAKAAGLRMAIHVKRERSYFFPEYYIESDRTITNLEEIYDILDSL